MRVRNASHLPPRAPRLPRGDSRPLPQGEGTAGRSSQQTRRRWHLSTPGPSRRCPQISCTPFPPGPPQGHPWLPRPGPVSLSRLAAEKAEQARGLARREPQRYTRAAVVTAIAYGVGGLGPPGGRARGGLFTARGRKPAACLVEIIPSSLSPAPPAACRPGRLSAALREAFFRPDMQSSDVEIGISHSAGPRWPRRPGRPPVPRRCVTGRAGMPPAWTSADVCASEVRVRQSLLDIWAPPAPPPTAHTQQFQAKGHVPLIWRTHQRHAIQQMSPAEGARSAAWKLPEGSS